MGKKARRNERRLLRELRLDFGALLIIGLSVLALSESWGVVGRALRLFLRFLFGNWSFVVPPVLIVGALYALIRRRPPRLDHPRTAGFLLLYADLLLFSHLELFTRLSADGAFQPSIVRETFHRLALEAAGGVPSAAGGGIIGALLFTAFYYLFGYYGTVIFGGLIAVSGLLLFSGTSVKAVVIPFKRRLSLGLRRLKAARRKRRPALARGGPAPSAPQAGPEADGALSVEAGGPSAEGEAAVWWPEAGGQGMLRISDFVDRVAEEAAGAGGAVDAPAGGEAPGAGDAQNKAAPGGRAAKAGLAAGSGEAGRPGPGDRGGPAARPDGGSRSPSADDAGAGEASAGEGAPAAGEGPLSRPYALPPVELLDRPRRATAKESRSIAENAKKLEQTLRTFGVGARVVHVHRGPAVTRFEVQPDAGVKVSRIVGLADDIALALAARGIRIEAPIPGKSAVGIEVPNDDIAVVTLREVLESPAFQRSRSKLTLALGRDITGEPIVADLGRMPHLLVAGATGSGKSVSLNAMIASILYKATPDDVKFVMIDPKMVELTVYNPIPHMLTPVVSDAKKAAVVLRRIVQEMELRYERFAAAGVRDIERFNAVSGEPLSYIVVIVDELADLMMVAAQDVEASIARLAQKARAAGIHLILATQRPSVDVITGVIKANIPSRIAFGVSSQVDSRTILDMAGAEKLLGRGDMLYLPMGAAKAIRVQGCFVSDREIEALVRYVAEQGRPAYAEHLTEDEPDDAGEAVDDELFPRAVALVVETKSASVSLLQRRFAIGYARAARLIDLMERHGIVGPYEGAKPRKVLVDRIPDRFIS
ncbi:DNA translocase FtsK [Hydrogenibacillus schlegelii]|uniref:FtsK domain-containing protein n=1 Tax=Hydrogenibacillus schlegelii TaxID=1484 RepID=A0A179IM15_HYDSH|nr:DNA translocase FtsK [Hydrogenibacillus schlegelii]OAR03678.1 hypothetical protein SA87_00345 [Hydrogenibacillus schlegelii]